jgi:Flp pilus assembly protein TadG
VRLRRTTARSERGAAVVDFVLVLVVLVPLVLGILQLGLTLYVRNTLASAAAEGARYGATRGASPADGEARTESLISQVVSERFASDVSARRTTIDGVPAVEVSVTASVPPLGIVGPTLDFEVSGRAVEEPE